MPSPNTPQTPKTTASKQTAQNTPVDFIGKSGTEEKNSKNELINTHATTENSKSSPRLRGEDLGGGSPPLKERTRGQSVWTPKRRAMAAARARRNKPWLHATGPKTAAGKAISRYNARKTPPTALEMRMELYMRKQKHFLRGIETYTRLYRAAHDPVINEAVKDRLAAMHNRLRREAIILHLILPSHAEILDATKQPSLSSPGLTGGSMDSPPSRGMTGERVTNQPLLNKTPLRSLRSFVSLRERLPPAGQSDKIFLAKKPLIPVYPPP